MDIQHLFSVRGLVVFAFLGMSDPCEDHETDDQDYEPVPGETYDQAFVMDRAKRCLLDQGVPEDCVGAYLGMAITQHKVVPSLGTFNYGEVLQWSRIVCDGLLQRVDEIVDHSSDTVEGKRPDIPWTAIWAKLKPGTAEVAEAGEGGERSAVRSNLAPPVCGENGDSLVLCASSSYPTSEGLVIAMVMDEAIPLADPERIHQFAFVFDSDGDPSNNYQASASYPNDFFHNTDRWYVANYTPQGGWVLEVSSAKDGTVAPVASDARMVLEGNSLLLVVPPEEFAVECPPYRMTAFTHTGDYGLNPPHAWSGDVEPAVDQPLAVECLSYEALAEEMSP